MTTQRWTLEWSSTPAERYGDVMWPAAEKVLAEAGLEVFDQYGGSMLGTSADEPDAADNGVEVTSDDEAAVLRLAQALTTAVGHEVHVEKTDDDE